MTATQDQQPGDRAAATTGLLDVLGRLIRTARAVSHRHQVRFGLSGTPLGILTSLAGGAARGGDLAARLQIAPSVVSRAVVPLEHEGLVERTDDPDDARAARLALTSAGRERLEAARREFTDRVTPVLERWDTDDVVTLTRLMSRLESDLAEGLDPASTGRGPRPTTS
ncbi:DNA-binding transcriptional regulator, MarR family [Friedmanniella luteola]|uniref:DNA-binding transcriptional regulator, MarR family n=1 Tax=Friedmanniella luteola TaxID=546871 RepID=A0A1H1UA57_9ACTN|nr:MarR family winged helix-turn-helix transcriptional regulator [Friedmanniella luteola]SDS69405.1 DNA-binding transcriptional regulator, MarR family [Friedmanniella luteola]